MALTHNEQGSYEKNEEFAKKIILDTQEETLREVREKIEGMKYQQPLLGTPVGTETLMLACNRTLDDVLSALDETKE